MKWNRKDVAMLLIGLIPAIVALLNYSKLPSQMATHFNANNEVDGFMARPVAVVMLLFLGVGVPLLLKVARKVDPKAGNYAKFEGVYEMFRWVMSIFMMTVGLFLVMYNLGYDLNVKLFTSPLIGLLFLILGNVMGKIRFNYTFGIRTPWTLSNEEVWRKTHRMAGPIWMAAGVVMVVGAFVPGSWSLPLTLSTIAVIVVIPTVYSYWLHRQLKA
ncbi:SdpI family protein [Paenibacillus sp. YN15]|uniref:SdpI family protein n=1 Tax=Paenibacillus sp. YN15 TaxID=1742774 RepID=UPI000DCC94DC|nr:SdpI family protein [Paenibacillus sp. YN15]RAV05635.1 hypothetical protein DQG13_03190 [Paenibacillus sp. YN15]